LKRRMNRVQIEPIGWINTKQEAIGTRYSRVVSRAWGAHGKSKKFLQQANFKNFNLNFLKIISHKSTFLQKDHRWASIKMLKIIGVNASFLPLIFDSVKSLKSGL
jgi:hypothetical protein